MHNATWICFDCRESVRRPFGSVDEVICSRCSQKCCYIGDGVPVPRKTDGEAWEELRLSLNGELGKCLAGELARVEKGRQLIKRNIEKLLAMPKKPSRTIQIRELEERLNQYSPKE